MRALCMKLRNRFCGKSLYSQPFLQKKTGRPERLPERITNYAPTLSAFGEKRGFCETNLEAEFKIGGICARIQKTYFPFRYASCSGVKASICSPIASSFMRMTSLSICFGTS